MNSIRDDFYREFMRRRAFRRAQRQDAAQQPYLLELPSGFRLHQLADMATRSGHRLEVTAEGRRLRLVPIQAEGEA
ncbi:MAG: hypothetical protein ACLFQ1_11745 [Halochromatium sp.]|uniref:hypothetical protein n=1 Tax=Halochromatium sp. TaxID=2049430 RepID=UPI00397E4C9E